MARRKVMDGMSLSELGKMLEAKRAELNSLQKERKQIQTKLDTIDRRIAEMSGEKYSGSRGGAGSRPRNEMSLVAALEAVLGGAKEPMAINDIVEGVQGNGYRSSSPNFRAIVNQTLIKDKRFTAASRGMYQMKK
jgi:septal ring factor EnvC (AmiA/AmiB activator)